MKQAETTLNSGLASSKLAHRYRVCLKGGTGVPPVNAHVPRSTTVLSVPLTEGSAKVRTGPPVDDEADYELPVWAGVIPLRQVAASPIDDPRLPANIEPPKYAVEYVRPACK